MEGRIFAESQSRSPHRGVPVTRWEYLCIGERVHITYECAFTRFSPIRETFKNPRPCDGSCVRMRPLSLEAEEAVEEFLKAQEGEGEDV
jgi:hypothetical protein